MFDGTSVLSIVIGTAIINALTFIVAKPIADKWFSSLHCRIQKANELCPMPGKFLFKPLIAQVRFVPEAEATEKLTGLSNTCFVLVDMLVLAIGGFCFGLTGLVFICIPFRLIALPGAVVFIFASSISAGMMGSGVFG